MTVRKLGTGYKKDESSQLADSSLVSDKYRKDLAFTESFMCQGLCWASILSTLANCCSYNPRWITASHVNSGFAHVTCSGQWTVPNVEHVEAWNILTHCTCPLLLLGALLPSWERVWTSSKGVRPHDSSHPSLKPQTYE